MVAEFYDSSAFTKLFINEPSSRFVRTRYANANLRVISRLAITEVTSAIARLRRNGDLSPLEAAAAISALRLEAQQCTVMAISEEVHAEADLLLEQQALRTLDALQLASALASNKMQPIYFVAANKRLSQVAQFSV